jgi:hypothetical protein
LPVGAIPKETHVGAMRGDVVDHVGDATTAACTETVLGAGEERLSFALPFAVIVASPGRRASLIEPRLALAISE